MQINNFRKTFGTSLQSGASRSSSTSADKNNFIIFIVRLKKRIKLRAKCDKLCARYMKKLRTIKFVRAANIYKGYFPKEAF